MRCKTPLAFVILTTAFAMAPAMAQTTSTRPTYGCFKVSVPEANVRATASKTGTILAVASKNEILIKRRRFCSVAGLWCAVTTKKGVEGFTEKSMISVAPCPARLSTKTN